MSSEPTPSDLMSEDDDVRVRTRLDRLLLDHPPETAPRNQFLGAQFDAGLGWVHFPHGHGGCDASPRLQTVVTEAIRSRNGPYAYAENPIGYGMGAPTVVAHASEECRHRWLRPLFCADEIWCQLFSEPGAGSDVASLSTIAQRDGDEWVLTGQKVWTTLAHVAKWGMIIARTDPDVPKHQGLTYFVLDMEAPGVEVRPLRQITGEAEFNEVFISEARIPDTHRLGGVGEGWRVSLTTLMNERVSIGGQTPTRGGGVIGRLLESWNAGSRDDPVRRDQVVRRWIEAEVWRLTNIRASQNRATGTPGPEGSVGKMMGANVFMDVMETAMDVLGAHAMLYGSYEMKRPLPTQSGLTSGDLRRVFLRSRANSIEGGTSEIMRNILGERVLGLPGEPRVDKELPWNQVPRG